MAGMCRGERLFACRVIDWAFESGAPSKIPGRRRAFFFPVRILGSVEREPPPNGEAELVEDVFLGTRAWGEGRAARYYDRAIGC